MTSRRFGRATASARARVCGLRRRNDDVTTLWEGDSLAARASVASAAGAQEEPLLGGVAVPRDGHGSRRDAAAHVCVYCCAHMNVFSLFFLRRFRSPALCSGLRISRAFGPSVGVYSG